MQTVQTAQKDKVTPGMLRGNLAQHDVDGQHVAEVAIRAGVLTCDGTNPGSQAKLPTQASHVTGATSLGVALLDTSKGDNDTANQYAIGDAIPIVKDTPGVWVFSEEAMARGDTVYARHTADVSGGFTQLGAFRNDAYTGTQCAAVPGARVEQASISIGGSRYATLISLRGTAAGATGAQGAQGATGATGPQGPQGPQGA